MQSVMSGTTADLNMAKQSRKLMEQQLTTTCQRMSDGFDDT